jgi:hypothetical protein
MGDSEIEYYKRMAEQCERQAESLPDIGIKRQFKDLARQWRDPAKRTERQAEDSSKKPRS